MKNLFPFLLLILVISACSSSEDPKPESEEVKKLVGTWTTVSTQTIMSVGDLSYKDYLISLGFDEATAQEASDMLEDMTLLTGFYAEMEIKLDRTWTGDSDFVETPVTGTWDLSADGKTLSLTNNAQPGVTQVATITKLDDTDFWMEIKVANDQLPPGTPAAFSYKAIIKQVRKK